MRDEGRVSRLRRLWLAALVAGALLAVGGCSSAPDMSGLWQGEVQFEDDEEALIVTLDLDQNNEGELSGTMRLLQEGDPAEEEGSVPISRGQVQEEGAYQIIVEQQTAFGGTSSISVDGEVEGDEMGGRFIFDGQPTGFSAEQISEEEAQRREEEREQERLQAERDQEEVDALVAEVEDLDGQIEEMMSEETGGEGYGTGYTMENRLSILEHAEGELLAALGDPEAPEQAEDVGVSVAGDEPSCDDGTLCEEAESYEAQLEEDRPELEGYIEQEEAGEIHTCSQAISPSYFEAAENAADNAASDYEEMRSRISTDRDELPSQFAEARELAREREDIASDLPEDQRPETSYSTSELNELRQRAEDASQSAEEALSAASEQRSAYEQRILQASEEALPLYEAGGCLD